MEEGALTRPPGLQGQRRQQRRLAVWPQTSHLASCTSLSQKGLLSWDNLPSSYGDQQLKLHLQQENALGAGAKSQRDPPSLASAPMIHHRRYSPTLQVGLAVQVRLPNPWFTGGEAQRASHHQGHN